MLLYADFWFLSTQSWSEFWDPILWAISSGIELQHWSYVSSTYYKLHLWHCDRRKHQCWAQCQKHIAWRGGRPPGRHLGFWSWGDIPGRSLEFWILFVWKVQHRDSHVCDRKIASTDFKGTLQDLCPYSGEWDEDPLSSKRYLMASQCLYDTVVNILAPVFLPIFLHSKSKCHFSWTYFQVTAYRVSVLYKIFFYTFPFSSHPPLDFPHLSLLHIHTWLFSLPLQGSGHCDSLLDITQVPVKYECEERIRNFLRTGKVSGGMKWGGKVR